MFLCKSDMDTDKPSGRSEEKINTHTHTHELGGQASFLVALRYVKV